jgi:hypothetical protein
MKYIVYQTINIVNNKIYIGVHKCKDPDKFDGYLGCGIKVTNPSSYMNPSTPLQYAVKKYGIKNFKRITLKVFDVDKDAYDYEKEFVNKEFVLRTDVYNAKIGGLGGNSYTVPIYQFSIEGALLKK